ncbi:sporulation related protein [Alkalispirillum mobile]|uniref:Sporulation related protein n=1 Tax=Alkalispirillum mobile TaxID=85925 RepID=A0A498CDE0_9GAMM|nr:SPOR domain-containing protein [Alkalispirillum mobile]RLK51300.1 sporulation related protein [Alkalispirillum mobile]
MSRSGLWLIGLLVAANTLAAAVLWSGWQPSVDHPSEARQPASVSIPLFDGPTGPGECQYRWAVGSEVRADALSQRLRAKGIRATSRVLEPAAQGYELRLTGITTVQEARARRDGLAEAAGYDPAAVDWPLAVSGSGGALRLYRHGSKEVLRDLQERLRAQGLGTELVPARRPGRAEVLIHGPLTELQEALIRGAQGVSDCHLRPD